VYSKVGSAGLHLQLGSTIIASLAVPLIIPIFVFYFYGSWFRARSKYAKQVQQEREDADTLPTSH
jgi:H+/gluconate symporter-like permease